MNVRKALNGAAAFLLLPVSLVPLYFAVPRLRSGVEPPPQERRPLKAPAVHPTKAETDLWRTVVPYEGAVPVLAYHGIKDGTDHYSVSQPIFAKQMEMLTRAGFHTISIAQYAQFLAGDTAGLPDRPILITFDDSRLDSYRGADRVLAEYGFRATMFTIVGDVDGGHRFYLNWDELRTMAQSGRWDIQEHAGVQHIDVRYDKAGHMGPAYSYRRMRGSGKMESFLEYRRRVVGDILWGKQALSEKIPGFTPWAFAVPMGDTTKANDPRIPPFLSGFLGRQFRAVFLTWPPDYSTTDSDHTRLPRIEIHRDTATAQLYRWLKDRIPRKNRTLGTTG